MKKEIMKRVGFELNGNENDFIEFLQENDLEFDIFQGALNDAVFVDEGFLKDGIHYERMALIPEFRNTQSNDLIIHLTDNIEWYDRVKSEWSNEQE